MQFQACLERAIATSREANFSRGYLDYVAGWLQPKNRLYGWHIQSSSEAIVSRKRTCIYTEHQLNAELLNAGLDLVSLGHNQRRLYRILRLVDRLQTRLNAWGLFPFT
jgi:hypothetical protein